jgi:hypothetical protein
MTKTSIGGIVIYSINIAGGGGGLIRGWGGGKGIVLKLAALALCV